MLNKLKKFLPVIVTCILIVVIIYLFATVKQPYVSCSKSSIDELGIKINESLDTTIDGGKIKSMDLTKSIILPDEFLKNDENLKYIQESLEHSYEYLGKDKVNFSILNDRVILNIEANEDETLVLNNIKFNYNDNRLNILINPNTRSSEVVALRIKDKYNESKFMTRMINDGYVCK